MMPKVEIIAHDIWQNGEECNTQSIKEALLREAVRQCEFYASDILIFLSGEVWRGLVSNEMTTAQLIFKNSGVDWIDNRSYDKDFIKENHIRAIATITIEAVSELWKHRNMKLIIDYGNC